MQIWVTVPALNPDLLEPSYPDDLGQTGHVVAISLHWAHLQGGMGVLGINADDGQLTEHQLVPQPHGQRTGPRRLLLDGQSERLLLVRQEAPPAITLSGPPRNKAQSLGGRIRWQ